MNMFIVSAASYFKFLQILVKQLMESKSEDLIYNHSINSLSLINKLKRCNTNPGVPSIMLYILSWQTQQISCIYANAAILDNKYFAFKTPGQSNFTKSLHTAQHGSLHRQILF